MLGTVFVLVIILLFVVAIFKIARREDGHADTDDNGFDLPVKVVGGILIGALVIWLLVKLYMLIDEHSRSGARTLIAVIAFMISGLLIRWLRK